MPLREAITTWPAGDLTAAVKHLPQDSATQRAELGDRWDWGHMAANLAQLVDLWTFWLTSEYARWIHDPDDPETKRRERERKRQGIKPPPVPLVPPVAHRPPTVAAAYEEQYLHQVAEHDQPRAVKELVSSEEFDRIFGLV